ncbi:MAG: tetratricopeptide repeat protein [Phycisphaerae bacterium]
MAIHPKKRIIPQTTWLTTVCTLLLLTAATHAEEKPRSGPALIKEGNRHLAEGRYNEALAAYDAAGDALPESAEVAYNRGIALYKLDRFKDAETAFQDALKPNKPELEAKAKYNLGRSAHAAAMKQSDDLERAINDLTRAIGFYKDALQLRPEDADAKHNAALARRLREYLTKVLAQQKEQQKKEPTTQPGDKQEGDESEKGEDSQQGDKQESNQDQKEGEQQGENQESSEGEQQDEQDQQGEEKGEQSPDEQPPTSQPSEQQEASSQPAEQQPTTQTTTQPSEQPTTQPTPQPTSRPDDAPKEDLKSAMIRISKEQAMRMLQEARDAERKRREKRRAEMLRRRGRIPVDKDW